MREERGLILILASSIELPAVRQMKSYVDLSNKISLKLHPFKFS